MAQVTKKVCPDVPGPGAVAAPDGCPKGILMSRKPPVTCTFTVKYGFSPPSVVVTLSSAEGVFAT
jgi:hypothetical protein